MDGPEGNWDALSILEGCLLRYPRVEGREHALDNWLPPLLGFVVGNNKLKNKNGKKRAHFGGGFPSSLPASKSTPFHSIGGVHKGREAYCR